MPIETPANERAAAKALARAGVYLCTSHEISPEIREYERGSTTLDQRVCRPADGELPGPVRTLAAGRRIAIMQSNGGFLSARDARETRRANGALGSGRRRWWVRLKPRGPAVSRECSGSTWAERPPMSALSMARRAHTTEAIRRRVSDSRADAGYPYCRRGRRIHRARRCGRPAARGSGERGRGSGSGVLRHWHGGDGHRRARGAGPHRCGAVAGRRDDHRCGARGSGGRPHCRASEN